MSKVETAAFTPRDLEEIKQLEKQLKTAIDTGALQGDLSAAQIIRGQINQRIESAKQAIYPFLHLHPELQRLLKEGVANHQSIITGGYKPDQLLRQLKKKHIHLSVSARHMIKSPDFNQLNQLEPIDLIHLRPCDLGFNSLTTYDEICFQAKTWGLEMCPPEVAPALRLIVTETDQPLGDYIFIATKPMGSFNKIPNIFSLLHAFNNQLCLYTHETISTKSWYKTDHFVFRLPAKKSTL